MFPIRTECAIIKQVSSCKHESNTARKRLALLHEAAYNAVRSPCTKYVELTTASRFPAGQRSTPLFASDTQRAFGRSKPAQHARSRVR